MPIPCSPITLGNLTVRVDAKKSTAIRTLQQQFGDGYMARRPDGINTVSETWSISTPPMPIEDLLALEAELTALGSAPFNWQPPGEPITKKWILDPVKWDTDRQTPDIGSLSFAIRRWYD